MLKRYGGKGTWAVVTGASDGIGAEFCRQLAEDGFNICLVSRTKEKLDAVEAELKQIAPNVETMVIQADFSDNANIEFYKGIIRQIVQKDVGFIVLNAGIGTRVPLGECDPKLSQNLLDTNVYHVATLMKLLLPVLENR